MSIGRPVEYSSEQVLDIAMGLFWRKGYQSTSLQELVGEMGLSRSSFYQAFGNKRQLFLSCLEQYEKATTLDLITRLHDAATGREFIEDTLLWAIEEVIEGIDPKGCLVVNTANELAQRDKQVAARVSQGFDKYRAIFLAAARRGQEDGSIRSDKESTLLANYLVTNMSGLRTMVKAGTNLEGLRGVVAMVMSAM
jgi:TetR/AcrR family transcriptional repressor of nem operon